MSDLAQALTEYLDLRRRLGYTLKNVEGFLTSFVRLAKEEGASYITTDLALRWAMAPANARPSQWANRLRIVRVFAKHLSALDARTEIPPPELLPFRYRRKPPYIYTDDEISRLLEAASALESLRGLRSRTYYTLFGLLVATGMRMSEPIALDRDDVDLRAGVLTVRRTKFGKTRLVPVHPSTNGALQEYARYRDRVYPTPTSNSFFISELGKRLTDCAVRYTFAKCSRQIGLREPREGARKHGHGHGPRLHDLRHRFAVKSLLRWYEEGRDVEQQIPTLSTYLGHNELKHTYWYLSAVPELLKLAAERVERSEGGLSL
jgi:integrase